MACTRHKIDEWKHSIGEWGKVPSPDAIKQKLSHLLMRQLSFFHFISSILLWENLYTMRGTAAITGRDIDDNCLDRNGNISLECQ